jgi:hypothetical protein
MTQEEKVVEAYRRGLCTSFEVQTALGFSSRWETDEFLKRSGAFLDYSEDDLEKDIETFRRLRG